MIMESANLHHQHHQLQENLVVGSSSSSSLPPTPSSSSCYALGTKHSNWTPTTTTLSNNSGNSSSSSLDLLNTSMAPDLGFQWLTNLTTHHHSPHDLATIKEELSASSSSTSSDHHPHNSFPKLTEMLTSTSSIDHDQYFQFIKNEENNNNNNINNNQVMINELSDKQLLLKTLSSSAGDHQFYSNHHHHHLLGNSNLTAGVQAMMPSSRSAGHFSQIYPSINISNLNRTLSSSTLSSSTSSLDMNLQAMDLLGSNSARFGTHHHQLSSQTDTLGSYIEQMHQTADHHYRLSSASNKISTFDNEVITEVKRPGSSIEPKVTQAAAPKKSRLESRTSSPCPPFKVRKEKLGDRIAALQQLVAPFGKTDTASVLMEAIGYIKFLQNQVETLSVPYMKMSRNKSCKTMQGGMIEMSGNGETSKRDLRSRGLCLVPLSCMSYVTEDIGGGGGSVWPTPDFGGGT